VQLDICVDTMRCRDAATHGWADEVVSKSTTHVYPHQLNAFGIKAYPYITYCTAIGVRNWAR
jgi:hypothetical protein